MRKYTVYAVSHPRLKEIFVGSTPLGMAALIASHRRALPEALRHWRSGELSYRSLEFDVEEGALKTLLRRHASRLRQPGWNVLLEPPRLSRAAALRRLSALLERAIVLDGAVKGTIEICDRKAKALRILCHSGLGPGFLRHSRAFAVERWQACRSTRADARPTIVADSAKDPDYALHRAVAAAEGYRSVKQVPLFCPAGRVCGLLSTFAAQPRARWDESRVEPLLPEMSSLLASIARR